ncbi:GntR family transcriptional regulator [Aeromicrobium sp.]|uniref:GntR family transcriptional regulator n=1 Tax=Aeromicrobium sp. TaxID=1871063 RepID=UPI0035176F2C
MPKTRREGALDADRAADVLRDLIVAGDLVPGQRLVERRLADWIGVSRVPVRQALHQLVVEGFATERPTGGVAVSDLSPDQVSELLEVAHALDAVAVRRLLAARTDLSSLRALLVRAGSAIDGGREADAVRLNAEFHVRLLDIAPAPTVRRTARPLRRVLGWALQQHADPAPVPAAHVALVDALEQGDADRVEAVLAQHVRTSRAALAERT